MILSDRRHVGAVATKDERRMLAPDDLTRRVSSGLSGSFLLLLLVTVLADATADVADAPAGNVKEAAVDLQAALFDVVLDGGVGQQDLDAGLDVELGNADGALLVVLNGVELILVSVAQRLERRQPGVQDTADTAVGQGGRGAAAGRVAAQHNVLHLEVGDGILDDGRGVDVGGGDDVGNVAVDKDVAGLQAQDGGLGTARVRAAKPD